MNDYIILALLAFMFGFFSDFADLFDEHGIHWFRGAGMFFGIVWGIAGAVMVYVYPWAGVYLLGMMLYWLVKNKIDYTNHQIATALILLAAFQAAFEGRLPMVPIVIGFVLQVLFVFLLYQPIKKRKPQGAWKKFFDIRHLIPPLAVAIIFQQPMTVFAFLIAFLGVNISDAWYQRIRKGTATIARKWGIRYVAEYDLEK